MSDKQTLDYLTPEKFGDFYEKNKERKLCEIFGVEKELESGCYSNEDIRGIEGVTATMCS